MISDTGSFTFTPSEVTFVWEKTDGGFYKIMNEHGSILAQVVGDSDGVEVVEFIRHALVDDYMEEIMSIEDTILDYGDEDEQDAE